MEERPLTPRSDDFRCDKKNQDPLLFKKYFTKYRTIKKLGEGSFGKVYKAEYKGEYYDEDQLNNQFGISLQRDDNMNPLKWMKGSEDVTDEIILHEKGELVDFITDELSFSIKSPVIITPQYSYDGSVNLIINDGVNIPRMINSRFSATGRNTYEIVDRKGNNDTNIYDQGEQFDIDTSLYKRVIKIPKIKFNVLINSSLFVSK